MRIIDLYRQNEPVVSFEFFPPKTDAGFKSLFRTVEELKRLSPGFVSVTMGAGGSTRSKTVDLSIQIEQEIGLTTMTHLPCTGSSREQITQVLDRLVEAGLHHVLALRGDPPREASAEAADGATSVVSVDPDFRHANELVEFIAASWDFCIGGACYPEVHPEAPNAEVDLQNLKRKVDAGAHFLTTQLFFDNARYFDFVERARALGIEVPIVAGIMPITSAAGVERMLTLGGGSLPPELDEELQAVREDRQAVRELGVRWGTQQCRELLERGVPGIHFFTLNQSPSTREIYENLF